MPAVPSWIYWVMAAAFFWLGLRWFERVQLYIPSRQLDVHPGTFRLEYETLRFAAGDGVQLHGWWIPAKTPGRAATIAPGTARAENGDAPGPVVLLLHGNAGNISQRVEKARLLHGLGLSVMLFDYRGYGESGGHPTERGLYRDAEAAYGYLRATRGVPAENIVFYGESLGCGVAVELARRHKPHALILESPFTSVVEMGKLVFPWLPVEWMIRDRFDNLAKLRAVEAPLLILHSPDDRIVPFDMGRRLFESAAEPKMLARLQGDHNEGFLESGRLYLDAVADFLRTHAGVRR